eukprot:m51a1_g12645 hypothetical protein (847) ;mRNA; r:1043-3767
MQGSGTQQTVVVVASHDGIPKSESVASHVSRVSAMPQSKGSKGVRVVRSLGKQVKTPHFSIVLVSLVILCVAVPVAVAGALITMWANEALRSQSRESSSAMNAGLQSLVEDRLVSLEELGLAQATMFLSGAYSAEQPEVFMRGYIASLVTCRHRHAGLSLTYPDGRLHGVVEYGGAYHRWMSWNNLTTCQYKVDGALNVVGEAEWCVANSDSRGIWYTTVNKSEPLGNTWVPEFVYNMDHNIYLSFSVAAYDTRGSFAGVVLVDQILSTIGTLIHSNATVNTLSLIIIEHSEALVATTNSSIATQRRNLNGDAVMVTMSESVDTQVIAAHRAVVDRWGTWSKACGKTFWADSKYVVSVSRISLVGLNWLVITISEPRVATIDATTIGAVVAVSVALVAISAVLSWRIVRPLNLLSKQMMAISHLDFGHAHLGESPSEANLSSLMEIREMQRSFARLRAGTRALTRYIAPQVVLDVMRSKRGDVTMEMRPAPLAILFTDLRGFTSLSEQYPHDRVVGILNVWFEEFGRAIASHNGTIDKFIGDCIMALFGAPRKLRDVEYLACATALGFAEAIGRVNAEAQRRELPALEYRVGVHSGSYPHDRVVGILNVWFEEFGRAIASHSGTIDKFIGDCIMALFGAPRKLRDVEYLACATALGFAEAIGRVNAEAQRRELPALEYRVGVHSGSVLVGHIGYSERVNYTVCGHTANVASRMEQLGKEYAVTPLVSGTVAAVVSERVLCVLLDVVFLRGHRVHRTRVYHVIALMADAGPRDHAVVASYNEIHAAMLAGDRARAVRLIDEARVDPLMARYVNALGVLRANVESGSTTQQSYQESLDATESRMPGQV